MMTGNRVVMADRLSRFFWEEAETTKKTALRLECVEPKYRSKRMLAIKRCKHLKWEKIRERANGSNSKLHFLFYYEVNKTLEITLTSKNK